MSSAYDPDPVATLGLSATPHVSNSNYYYKYQVMRTDVKMTICDASAASSNNVTQVIVKPMAFSLPSLTLVDVCVPTKDQ